VLFLCFACVVPRVVLGALRVQHKPTYLSTPVFPMQNPCQHAHWHRCCTPCKTRATSNVGTDVAPLQYSCQPWTWHECCNTSKTRANIGHARVVPIVIHRLSTGCLMQYSCHFQCWHRCCYARSVPIVGQMLGRGRGLTYVFICSSHSSTKKVKTRKKEP
jgi:hypothetical protein